MKCDTFEYDIDACPACGQDETLAVLTAVCETAIHTDDTRRFKDGGQVEGELKVECTECDTTIWTAETVEIPSPDVEAWEPGEPCTACGASRLTELSLDWQYRDFEGTWQYDGDRLATPQYNCRECGSVLGTIPVSELPG